MGLFRAMNTGASGVYSSSTSLETIGDNIANLNTTAFKSTRANQESLFALTLAEQRFPLLIFDGGMNPMQVGLGSTIGSISRDFAQGTTVTTGVPTDLALDGNGFFVLADDSPGRLFTRDGSFALDANQQLVSNDGLRVQGWQANEAGDIDASGEIGALTIPLGLRTYVQATTEASLDGNLDAADVVANRGAVQRSSALLTGTDPATPATAATRLTDVVDMGGNTLFSDGDVIEVSNVRKGEVNIITQPLDFTVGVDGSTVQDFLTFLEGSVAIHTDPTLPPTGLDPESGEALTAGVSLDADGRMVVASNVGGTNAVIFDPSNIVNSTTGRSVFLFEEPSQTPTGMGVSTEFAVFDSLGGEANLRLRLVQAGRDEFTTTWQWYAESIDDSDVSKALDNGTLTFDANGQFVGDTDGQVTINLADRGAEDLSIALDLASISQLDGESQVLLNEQNGAPLGVLQDFSIDEDGIIDGGFSNGVNLTLGQIAVAQFRNEGGLKLQGGSNYSATSASGLATVTTANTDGAARVMSRTLEQSNVELTREFIGLINTSTQFSASSRVISAADELLQGLLLALR